MSASPYDQIRVATRPAHDRVEALPLMQRLMSSAVTRVDYARVIGAFHALHIRLEPAIYAQLGELAPPGLPYFTRIDDLELDAAALGLSLSAPVMVDAASPSLTGPAAALGGLYVFEGARLGGKTVNRHLVRYLGEGLSCRYFSSDGVDVGRRWAAFRRHLDGALAPADATAQAVAGALATFACIEQTLSAPVDRDT
jgi:heme oxygenase